MELDARLTTPRRWHLWLQILVIPGLVLLGLLLIALGYDWRAWIQQPNPQGYLLFFVFVCLLPLIAFPISAFYVFAGLAFPPLQGLLLTAAGLLVNMSLGYWIGRRFLHQPLSSYLQRTRFNPALIREGNLLRMTVLIRSVPGVPFFMQNYVLGLAKTPFWAYLFISWSIQSIYCAGTIFLTHSGMRLDSPVHAVLFVAIAILLFGLIGFLKSRLARKLPSEIDSNPTNPF